MQSLTLVIAIIIGTSPTSAPPTVLRQEPSVATLAAQLSRGRLVLEQARFKPESEQLFDGVEPLLLQTVRALSRSNGRFAVLVAPERDRAFPPDTVLSRRRTVIAARRLIAAGANPDQLQAAGAEPGTAWLSLASVAPGRARIELLRIE